jgi:hypothetical protein
MTPQEALKLCREALTRISETKFGWDGDCGTASIADNAIEATMPEKITRQNFCADCGKRNGPEGHIHTCAPTVIKDSLITESAQS